MNLKDFENSVLEKILERGYDYYLNGNIFDFNEYEKNKYSFEIDGSENYEVIVNLNNNQDIIYSECNCPYNFGPTCKHEVAAYFKLREISNSKLKNKEKNLGENNRNKKANINEILSNLSKEELIKIILEKAKFDKDFRGNIFLEYSEVDIKEYIKECKKAITNIKRKYKGRYGYIEYNRVYEFAREFRNILEKVEKLKDILGRIDFYLALLVESVKAIDYSDDSSGYIGDLIYEIENCIEDEITLIEFKDSKEAKDIFKKIIKVTNNKAFDGWNHYKVDIIRICSKLAYLEDIRLDLKEKIILLIDGNSKKENASYYNDGLVEVLFNIIDSYEGEEESEKFIKDNIEYDYLKEALINKYLQKEQYDKVIELTLKWENEWPKLKWKKLRYEAYKKSLNIESQKELGKELLLEGNFDYYEDLKELEKNNFKEFYENIKKDFKKKRFLSQIFISIILKENDLDELMEVVLKDNSYIENYGEILSKKFNDEVCKVYKKYILNRAEPTYAKSRKDYQKVCRLIKKSKKIIGNENFINIIEELMDLYKRKPAFIDELNKLK